MVAANGLEFGLLEAGNGPLALCLHGFPDCAHTWRHLLPALAGAGFHAVAPFLRGYAPTTVPDDARYSIGALVADVVALHQALDGDGQAVLIGHDWGAEAAYGAAAFAPDRWRRVVTLAVPPPALDPVLFGDYQQLKRFFYLFWFRDSPARAVEVVAADKMAVLDRLWRDWSPGYDPAEDRGGCRPLPAPGAAGGGQRAHPRLGHRVAGWLRLILSRSIRSTVNEWRQQPRLRSAPATRRRPRRCGD
jgi:pimeloyl-ACP methyl ester carboxylesterase